MTGAANNRWVEIQFDCLPLRSVGQLTVPDDASPKLSQKIERIQHAVAKHGAHNSYYLHNARCRFHLTNDPQYGMLDYEFEGTLLTNANDLEALRVDLAVSLQRETCAWLNQSIVEWFAETVQTSVLVEFNRYIQDGDLGRTLQRLEQLEKENEAAGGFVGMYL